jgi:transposase
VVGAHAVLKRARHQPEKYPWVTRLLERKPFRIVAVAVANKMARVAWALLARGGSYRAPALAARCKESGDSRVSLRLCAYGLQG